MANKKIKVTVNLDFTSDRMSIEKIREQIDAAVSAVKINLDPESAKKFEAELRELGKVLERHLNQNTGKINAKNFVADLDNRENFLMIEKLGKRYAEVGVNAQQSFRKIANEADFLSKKITVSNKALEKMGTTLMNTIRWNISSSAVNAVTNEFRKMYYFAKDLDRVLTNIRIVTGQSADQMERFALAANESAKALRVSTIEYAQAATLFFQQGLKEADVKKMTDGAIMASRITGIAAADMADLLTSTMNGYRLAADEVIKVTDKLAAVGATTASDFHEIATGMSKVASMANTAGVSIDELTAQIATIVSVTRESPESIGTSLKTIYGRMLMFKTDMEALMEDEDGELFGAPKVEEALQAYSRAAGKQISLFKITADGRKELRDLGEVIEEIGNSWDTVTDKTVKFGLATALAGSRQQNRLIALFDSWDMYKKAVETSLNAEGTTLRQNAIYLESYEGKLKELQAAKEELYMVLTDSDSMKLFIGALTEAVQLFTKLADMAGGFSAVLGVIGAAFSDNLVKKAYEFQQAFVLPKEMKITGQDSEQIKFLKELHTISKAFGADEANRYKEDLRNKRATLKEMKVESDLLQEKVTLLKEIKEISKKDSSKIKKNAEIDIEIAAADARGVEVQSAEELKVKYNELAEAQQKLIELKKLSGDLTSQEVKDAQAAVDALESQIESIHKKAVEAAVRSKEAYEEMEEQVNKTSSAISAKAEEAERLTIAIQATRAAFMLLPAAISGATDSSKSLGEVLKNIGMLTLPSILSALQPIIASLWAAKGTADAFSLALFKPLLPIIAVTAAVMALAAIIKKIKENSRDAADAFEDMTVAAQELSSVEDEYNKVADSLESIKDRIEEIKRLQEGSLTASEADELTKELEQLEIKKSLAEEEMIVQEYLLKVAKEKAELAAIEAANAKMKSEYLTKDKDIYMPDGSVTQQAAKVTIVEELQLSAEAYKKYTEAIKEHKNKLADLENQTAKNAKEEKDLESQKAKLIKTIRETEAAQDSARDSMTKYLSQVREIIANLNEEDEAQKTLIDTHQEVVDMVLEIMGLDLGYHYNKVTDAVEDSTDALKEHGKALKELTEKFETVTSKIQEYYEILDELNSKEGLSAKSKQDIITKHQQLLPYINDEKELRKQLIQIIAEEEKTQQQAYANMLMHSSEFYDAKIKGNKKLVDTLNEKYGIDLKNYGTLAGAKLEIEKSLLETLGDMWSKYYDSTHGVMVFPDADTEMAFWNSAEGKAYRERRRAMDEFQRELDAIMSKSFESLKDINLSGIKGGKSSSAKDDRKFLETIDAEIRAIKLRNDNLIKTRDLLEEQLNLAKDIEGIEGLNKQYEITGQIIKHNEKILESFKDEQDAVHQRANDIREQYSQYNIDSWFDDNAEATVAYIEQYNKATKEQQEEMQKVFNRVQKLKQAWVEANNEIKKVLETNKELTRELEKHPEKVRKFVKELIELEKRNVYLDLEMRQREANERLKRDKEAMEREVRDKQDKIDELQSEIDKIQKDERTRQENLERSRRLDELAKLQERYYHLQYVDLKNITDEQARSLGLEQERTRQLENQAKLQELKLELHDLENNIIREPSNTIEELEREIKLLEEQESYRKEQEQREKYLSDIRELEQKHYYLANNMLGKITEEQAEALGLEKEREQYLQTQEKILKEQEKKQKYQNELLEIRNKLDNVRNEKNIQQLKKLEDGTWQFEYVEDQREIDKLEEQIEDIEKKISDSHEYIEKLEKDHNKTMEKLQKDLLKNLQKTQKDYDEWERQNRLNQHLQELRDEVNRLKQIENIREQIKKLETEHSNTLKELRRATLEDLQKAQEDYDEWERQNRIQRQIEEKQDRIKKYQDEIEDLQNKFSEIEDLTNEAFKREKENLDRFYSDIDLLTDEKMKDLDDTFDNNWSSIYDTITGYFNDITDEYRKLIRTLSEPLPTSKYGEGGYYTPPSSDRIVTGSSSSSNTKDYGKGAATGQAAIDNEARLNSDPAFRQSEIERTKQVISNRKEAGMDTSVQERYLNRLITGSYHSGGRVGDGSRDLPEVVNKLFNTRPNEQIVKALKGELFIPEENIFKNFLPNLQNLFNMVTSNITVPKIPSVATASGGDTIYYINELNVPTNDFQSFIKDFTNVVENHPNKTIMKVKKIGGLK